VALLLFALVAVFGDHGFVHLLRMQAEQRRLEDVAFALQQRNEQLRERIRRYQTDDLYLEKLARERLGLVRHGEIVYRTTAPQADGATR
jgi:cell division protein FtsB